MKFIKFLFIFIVVIVLVAGIGLWLFIKNFDVNEHKAGIEKNISEQIDRNVSIGNLALNLDLKSGVRLTVENFVIEDDPQFGQKTFLDIESVFISLNAMKLIQSKTIEVTNVELNKPKIHLVKLADGTMNIPQSPAETVQLQLPVIDFSLDFWVKEAHASPFSPEQLMSTLTVNDIQLKNGYVTLLDHSLNSQIPITIESVDLNVKNVGFEKDFPFDLTCGLFGKKKNLDVEGQLWMNSTFETIKVKNTNVNSKLSQIDLNKARSIIEGLAPIKSLGGMLKADLSELSLVKDKDMMFSSKVFLRNVSMEIDGLPEKLEGIEAEATVTESSLNLQKSFIPLADGQISLDALVTDYLGMPKIRGNFSAENLVLGELLKKQNIPVDIRGKVFSKLQFQAQGNTPEDIKRTLSGKGNFEVGEGMIADLNVTNMMMEKLETVAMLTQSGLSDRIDSFLQENYASRLNQENTLLKQARVVFDISNQRMNISEGKVQIDEADVDLSGSVGLDGYAELNPRFRVEEVLSQGLVKAVRELEPLLNQQNRLELPMQKFSGQIQKFSPKPDQERLVSMFTKALLQKKIGEQLQGKIPQDVLQKVPSGLLDALPIGGSRSKSNTAPLQENAVTEEELEQPKKNPKDQVIQGVSDLLFNMGF